MLFLKLYKNTKKLRNEIYDLIVEESQWPFFRLIENKKISSQIFEGYFAFFCPLLCFALGFLLYFSYESLSHESIELAMDNPMSKHRYTFKIFISFMIYIICKK